MTKHYLTRPILLRSLLGTLVLATTPLVSLAASAEQPASTAEARVIVKFKKSRLATVMSAASTSRASPRRAQALGNRLGMALKDGAVISDNTQVVLASGIDSQTLAQRLEADPDVDYVAIDRRRKVRAVVNDPLYLASTDGRLPASGQWYLRSPIAPTVSSINADAAWVLTTGKPSVVVADLDSGIRPNHPDLRDKLLPGYDFIADITTANDKDGRDSDPSDPGDWVTAKESSTAGTSVSDCEVFENSSWHGTQTAGLIGAATNNGIGMAGVGYQTKVLPVRVLGKCGGFDSDIVAGMRWAAGLPVDGQVNPYPARVINMSLGYPGSCNPNNRADKKSAQSARLYIDAIFEVRARNVSVVVSAGNASAEVDMPGNCPGVISVGGLRHAGTKNGFSSFGPEVTISAPAGNCVNVNNGGNCLYPILSTFDTGATTPGEPSYSISSGATGTSFSAPQVAGTIALMLALQPSLTPDQITSLIKSTARPFPSSSNDPTVPQCIAGVYQDNECHCTTGTCGAGMLDAYSAVAGALHPPAAGTMQKPVYEDLNATTSNSGDSGGGGGGALGLEWLAGLALAIAALALPRRNAPGR